jgi:hypothetical protein
MSDTANCIILRRVSDQYSTRGPAAAPMTEKEALAEARDLSRRFPQQIFAVLQEICTTENRQQVSVKRSPPKLAAIGRIP